MASFLAPENERFSLDDPEAGRKLVENLDERRVRLDFSELCWHFRCEEFEEKMRLRNFLIDLDRRNLVVEVLRDLYCRPALAEGSTKSSRLKKIKKPQRKRRRAKADGAAVAAPAEPVPTPTDDVA